MSFLSTLTGVGQALGGAFDIAFNLFDRFKRTEQQEFENEFVMDESDYNKALQQQIFDREDTAYSRTVNDMMNAGLSPLAMTGTNDSGSVVGNMSPPSNNMDFNPMNAAGMLRSLQEMALARDENKRQQALSENTIAFNNAQIGKFLGDSLRADKQQLLDWQINSAKINNDYKLGMFDLLLTKEKNLSDKQLSELRLDLERDIANNNKIYQSQLVQNEKSRIDNEKMMNDWRKSMDVEYLLLDQDEQMLKSRMHDNQMSVEQDKLFYQGIDSLIKAGSELLNFGSRRR